MPFIVPNFNLPVNIWRFGSVIPGPPTLTTIGNLAWGRRQSAITGAENPQGNLLMTLLLPPGTDVRAAAQSLNSDVAEVPAGTGRYYHVMDVDDIGKGFPNEHRAATLLATDDFGQWPTPYP